MGLLLALLIWAMTLLGIVCVRLGTSGMLPPASDAARAVDSQLALTHVVIGIAFVVVQGLLGLFVLRYRGRSGASVRHVEASRRFEAGSILVVGTVFLTLAVLGQRVWAQLHLSGRDPGALVVEVVGEQFAWNVRYTGPDGIFGRTDPRLYEPATNPLGLVAEDPAGLDDVVSTNLVVVPVDQAVELRLGSKDVLHSFFVPALRIKQDTLPGLHVPLRFRARRTGEFEVPCAELCGLGHYRMKGVLRVVSQAEFETWLTEQGTQ
jgi:cytochrome c oxidase subunit 2